MFLSVPKRETQSCGLNNTKVVFLAPFLRSEATGNWQLATGGWIMERVAMGEPFGKVNVGWLNFCARSH
jgi:hypothetical protein